MTGREVSVLLVDDHQENLLALESILEGTGLTIVRAQSGRDALRHCLVHDFAVILLDVQMPDMDGFETAALVRQRERSRHTPIIFLTAYSNSEDMIFQGYSVGAVDYMFKPFVPEVLKAKVAVFVDLFEKTEELRELREAEVRLERERAQEAVRESETRFRTIFEDAPIGTALIGPDYRILETNKALQKMLGYTEAELHSLTFMDVTHPEDASKDVELAKRMFRGEIPGYELEKRYVKRNGDILWVHLTGTLIRGQDGAPIHALGMVEDITERKRAEQQIHRQVQRLAALRSIDMAITGSLDLRVTLNVLLDQVISQLAVDAASVLLLDRHSQRLGYAAGRGFRNSETQRDRLRLGEGLAGQVAVQRKIINLPDLSKADASYALDSLPTGEGFASYCAAPLVAKGQVKGVLEVFNRRALETDQEWLDFLEALAGQAAIAIDSAALFDDLQHSNLELGLAYDTTLEGWARAMDLRDKETEGHSQRVAEQAVRLGRVVGMSEAELVHVRRGALLHDIGKLAIPDGILLKPGPLTDDEWEIMRKHPGYAYEMLAPIAFLRQALDIPYCHHEKWDGTGYPRGIKGEQIPMPARIFAVVDVWEALSSDRPYRAAWPEDKMREYIAERAGTQFDPEAVNVAFSTISPEGRTTTAKV